MEQTLAARLPESPDATLDSGPGRAGEPFTPHVTTGAEPAIRGYTIERELGRGGMGVVYLARQVGFERTVALKVLSRGHEASDLARFRIETSASAALEHPNIVPVYDAGEDSGVHFFSMRLVSGGTLAQGRARYLKRPRAIATLLSAIAAGMSHAHQRGILHRDLKPANILLDEGDVPLIADFGLAKRSGAEDLTRSGQIVGTPGYMAPEQATGKVREQTTATDVYAMGAILYELLTGRPPFVGDSLVDVLRQVAFDEPVAPSRLEPDTDGVLEAIALKCLEKNPQDRYSAAGALQADLEAYLRGDDVSVVNSSAARYLRLFLRDSRHVEVMALWSRVWEVQALLTLGTFLGVAALMYDGRPLGQCGSLLIPYLGALGLTFWHFRVRRPVPFAPVERQLAYIGAGLAVSIAFALSIAWSEHLKFAQWAAFAVLNAGLSFHAMGLVLGGSFYPLTAACYVISLFFAKTPVAATAAFGVAAAIGLYIPAHRFSPCRKKVEKLGLRCA